MVSSSLSAVICTQNDERTIKACAESFLNFCEEVIVVVNNSTDRTWDIISAVNDDVFFGKLIKVKVDGITDLSEARNMGFSISSGDWIIRADGDFICYSERDVVTSVLNSPNSVLRSTIKFISRFLYRRRRKICIFTI